MKTAVIIARFQTPYLHEGHKALFNTIFGAHAKIVVVLGVSPLKGGKRNPFDYHVRERMIKGAYPNAIVLPLRDHPVDAIWSDHLDHLLSDTFP
ncbi:MAG: NUDIX hydrolase, partial [Cytophagales bacterium]|nr:NUDIX hydrolase [Cytophaga sp.]